jgi:phosphatidate cytidylyltransferase
LPYGVALIALLIGLAWLDQRVDALAAPAWLSDRTGQATWPPGTLIFVVLAVLCVLASRELAAIMKVNGIRASKRITTAAGLFGLGASCLIPESLLGGGATGGAITGTAAIVVLLTALLYYSRNRSFEGVVAAAGGAMLAFVYLGLMLGFFLAARRHHDVWTLLWVVLVTKSSDIGAYATGRLIGRHKLIPWLSPGKTWEGLVGGMALASAMAYFTRGMLDLSPPIWALWVIGIVFAVVGQLGDLIASLFKRDAGLKDSGRLIPGFGGVLDVLDSPILVAPLAYWWLQLSV